MNQNYFYENEDICSEKLRQLNDKYHLFDEMGELKRKSSIDWTGVTCTGKVANIELKNRNYTSDYFPTLYIESHKWSKLIIDWLYEGKEPLYINFMRDGVAMIFNLSKLKNKPKFSDVKKIKSNGYEGFEISARIELDKNDAYIYRMP